MHHRSISRSVLVILLAGLFVALAAGLVACGEAASQTTAAPATAAAPTTTAAAPTTTTPGKPQELTVSAASSLKAAFTKIGEAFDKANNAKTTFNFDSSGTLQEQIEAGAPTDVFASAAVKQMNTLLEGGFIDEISVQIFASNGIVLAVPAGSTLGIAGFEDLAKPEVKKVAYGDPASVPHGTYAEEVLTSLGLIDQVKPRVIYTKNATQTLEYVSSGEIDAGMMFSTDVIAGGDKVKLVVTADPSLHSEILYPIGTVKASENKTLAQAFVDFVMSSEGQAILKSYGFVQPPAADGTVEVNKDVSVEVRGLVDNPETLAAADIQAMKMTTVTAEHPKSGPGEYTGVLLSDLMAAVGVQSGATVLNMGSTDGFMGTVNLAELDPNSMISIGDDGKLNAVMPGQSGKAWAKDINLLEFQ